jgi:hypothetical protein
VGGAWTIWGGGGSACVKKGADASARAKASCGAAGGEKTIAVCSPCPLEGSASAKAGDRKGMASRISAIRTDFVVVGGEPARTPRAGGFVGSNAIAATISLLPGVSEGSFFSARTPAPEKVAAGHAQKHRENKGLQICFDAGNAKGRAKGADPQRCLFHSAGDFVAQGNLHLKLRWPHSAAQALYLISAAIFSQNSYNQLTSWLVGP